MVTLVGRDVIVSVAIVDDDACDRDHPEVGNVSSAYRLLRTLYLYTTTLVATTDVSRPALFTLSLSLQPTHGRWA